MPLLLLKREGEAYCKITPPVQGVGAEWVCLVLLRWVCLVLLRQERDPQADRTCPFREAHLNRDSNPLGVQVET